MSKLNNVKAVNEMIRGEHRTQTQKSKGFEKQILTRKVGDSWVDKDGMKWIQKDGYKAKVSKFNKIRQAGNPTLCPKCSKTASQFDKQFITREGMCHHCIVKQETLMICEGYDTNQPVYERWERNRVRKNVNSFLQDAAKDVQMLKNQFTRTEYVNSNGTVDKWSLPKSAESIEQGIDKQFDMLKDKLLQNLDQGDEQVGIKNTTTE